MTLNDQLLQVLLDVVKLLVLAIPVAWAAWTVTHEEVFRETKEYCQRKSKACQWIIEKKFFYLFTCEYCFSHWCTLVVLLLFRFKMIFPDYRGYLVSFPALVWTANIYMNWYQRNRVEIRKERAVADTVEIDKRQKGSAAGPEPSPQAVFERAAFSRRTSS